MAVGMSCSSVRILGLSCVALGSACGGGDDAPADETSSGSSSSGGADAPSSDPTLDDSESGAPADSTSEGGTTGGDDTTSGSTTGDDTSAGTDTTSSDDTTTGVATDATTTDDDTTTGDESTGGDVLPGGCAEACEPGCTSDLLLGLAGTVAVGHDGTTILARGDQGRAGLWRASDLTLVLAPTDVDDAAIAGGIAAFEREGAIEIVDATDGSLFATIPASSSWGLADDGSYVWTADGGALSRWETDGSSTWSLAGNFAGASVLALPTGVHAYAPATADVVHHVDAATGMDDDVAFDGDFGGWFADAPRFWSTDGDTYRVYEPDGTQLAFEFGDPAWGAGDRLALWDDFHLLATIVDATDADTPLGMIAEPQFSGPAAIGLDPATFDDVVLVRLDDPALVMQPVVPGCCIDGIGAYPYDFAWRDDAWVLGGEGGQLFDQDGVSVTPGEISSTQGALAGRFVATTVIDRTHVFDVDDACIVHGAGSFARSDREAVLSDDGLVLMAPEKPYGGGYTGQLYDRFYDTSTGTMLAEYGPQLSSSTWMGGQLSTDGAVFSSSTISLEIFTSFVATQPDFDVLDSGFWGVVPGIAPDGALFVRCDAVSGFGATLEGAQSYVVDADGPLSIIDGVAWGFLAADRVLVGHYVSTDPSCYIPGECDAFVSSEVVDLDGDVVAGTTLPETRWFERVSDTEIFASDAFAIWDVYSGEQLWQAPASTVSAAAVGSDFVVSTDGAVLTLTRWR